MPFRSLMTLARIGLMLLAAGAPAAAAHRNAAGDRAPLVYVGGQKIAVRAMVDHGRVFVPVRGVFQAIDASVEYSPPHFVVVRQAGAVIAGFILDRPRGLVGRRRRDLDVAPVRRDGRIYVPLRIVAEAAGARVSYSNRPPIVHIWKRQRPVVAALAAPTVARPLEPPQDADGSATRPWALGAAIGGGICLLGFIAIVARRYSLQSRAASRPARRAARPAPWPSPEPVEPAVADSVNVTTVAASGEARFRKELITEKRTIEVAVTREELVIEYAGEGGTVLIEGRILAPGETVRIPLWEERVDVDVTKHQLVTADIVVEKRRVGKPHDVKDGLYTAEVGVMEPGPG